MKYKDEKCKWKLRANKIGESNAFKVSMYNDEHSCEKYSMINKESMILINM